LKELAEAITNWRKAGAGLSLVLAIMTGLVIFVPDELPKQRVFIAGDAVVHPIPYAFGPIHPSEGWLR